MSRSTRCLVAFALGVLLVAGAPAQGGPVANDPVFTQGLQWGLERIGAPAAWATASGAGVTIAVVDSGVDLAHQDLRDKLVGSMSCIGANDDPSRCSGSAQDDNGHGSHVAGIALAVTGNRIGVAGVAPDAKLLAVRVLANDCSGTTCTASGTVGDVSAGIRWATDHGARVINLSLGGGKTQSALGCSFCDAIDYAWSKGVIAVVAAGNDSVLPSGFADEPALVVTATNREDQRASYSNSSSSVLRAARWPVAAPGGEPESQPSDCSTDGTPKGIVSTYWVAGETNQYACLAGTSMAAPHVSGALAVLLSMGYTPQQAVDRLLATAKDLGTPGRDDSYGYGRIDLAAAVGATPGTTTTHKAGPAASSTTSRGATSSTGATSTAPADTSTIPPLSDPNVPVVSTPQVSAAAPFRPAPAKTELPGGVVALALLVLLGSGVATTATAWRMLRQP